MAFHPWIPEVYAVCAKAYDNIIMNARKMGELERESREMEMHT